MLSRSNKKSKNKNNNKRQLITHTEPKSPISEQYRTIRTNLSYSSVDKKMQVILITSADPSAGKSTTAANIAVAYSQSGNRTLLIDGDMRKPTVHHTFELPNQQGLSNAIVNDEMSVYSMIHESMIPSLYVLTAGPVPPNPSELIASQKMEHMIEELRTEFDTIIIDTPPVLAVTDATVFSNYTDGTLMVINAQDNNRNSINKAKNNLEKANANILGIIMNNVKNKASDDYYYYKYYG